VRFGVYALKPDWSATQEWAQLAEQLGFDSFWNADHRVGDGSYSDQAWAMWEHTSRMCSKIKVSAH
jgi:alkanesulfonate monooxygenase SsuD/methylene tetrahydromethanopterin reductase-like flavin-dependent oxidoreductase (luciferase family)